MLCTLCMQSQSSPSSTSMKGRCNWPIIAFMIGTWPDSLDGRLIAFSQVPRLPKDACVWPLKHSCCCFTVDGRNPAPVDRWFIPLFTGFYTSQVVQDFLHQQYHYVKKNGWENRWVLWLKAYCVSNVAFCAKHWAACNLTQAMGALRTVRMAPF